MAIWKVIHLIQPPIPYDSGPLAYQSSRITVVLQDAKIVQIEQEVDVKAGRGEEDVMADSTDAIATILEAINYWYGQPANVVGRRVEKPPDQPGGPVPSTSQRDIKGSFCVAGLVRLPDEKALLTRSRLRTWLHLMNASRPPAKSWDAVGNYWWIWEDMHPGNPAAGTQAEELLLVRNFVSHPEIDKKRTGDYLRKAFNSTASKFQFDPNDPQHMALVDRVRWAACTMLRAEIEKHL